MFCRHLQPFVGLAHCDDDDKCDTCAIVIAPDYAYPRPGRGDGNLRADFHQYLIDAGVLPTPLPVGQEHILDLKRALDNKGAHVTLLRDNATALEVVRTIKCHANRCKTLLVYFCGHGSPMHVAPSGTNHGALDLVGTDQLLPEYVLETLKSVGFKGKLIYVINSCSAGKLAIAAANASIVESQLTSNLPKLYDTIMVTSTPWGYGQSQSKGEQFGRKFIDIIGRDSQIPIKQWKQSLDASDVTYSPTLKDFVVFT